MILQEALRDKVLSLFALVLALLVYGSELANFSLSIDEEIHSYDPDIWVDWASQGRWGMALLTYTLPPLSPLPFLPTVLFCVSLAFSALLLSRLTARSRQEGFVFVGFFVSSPIWLHVGEFNTFSWGFGFALSLVALATNLAVRGRRADVLFAGFCAGFAIGVYQAMFFLYAVIMLTLSVRNRAFWEYRNHTYERSYVSYAPAISFAVAGALYYVVNSLVLAFLDRKLIYTGSWIRLGEFASSFSVTASKVLLRMGEFVMGTDPTFLDWGTAVLLLPWLGFVVGVGKTFDRRVDTFVWRLVGLTALGLAVMITFAPVIISAARIPTRALVALPFLYSILAVNAFRVRFGSSLRWGAFGVAMFVSIWISAALFYSDSLARQRDSVLAARLVNRVENVGRQKFGKFIPVAVVGSWSHELRGPARQVQIFGESFFEHGGGNYARIGLYLRLQGLGDLKMVSVTRLRAELDRVNDMPSWPEAGSVAVVDDVVVVKLGPLSHPQKMLLKR